jgi:hypothetical protein
MSPGQLVDHAMDMVRNHGGADFARNLGSQVTASPLPITMIAAGMAWLMLGSRAQPRPRSARSDGDFHYDDTEHASMGRPSEGSVQRAAGAVSSAAESGIAGARDVFASAAGSVDRLAKDTSEMASMLGDAAARGAHDMRDRLTEVGSSIGERARTMTETAGHSASMVRSGIRKAFDEQPLLIGVVGLAVGAIAAVALPRSRREDELMGGASDSLKTSVVESAREKLGEAKDAAASIMADVEQSVMRHGATDEPKAESGRPRVSDVSITPEAGDPAATPPERLGEQFSRQQGMVERDGPGPQGTETSKQSGQRRSETPRRLDVPV